jgi:hypothetical protein
MQCSATADLSGCPRQMCQWCSLTPGLDGMASLPNVDLTTLARYTVHAWSRKSQIILHRSKETGNLPRGEAQRFYVPGEDLGDAIEGCADKGKEGN